jgi:hypothetical protein
MSLIDTLRLIIDAENDFETKLQLLTEISISTTNDELFRSCERVRNELVESSEKDEGKGAKRLSSSKSKRISRNSGDMEPNRFSESKEAIDLL